MRPLLFCVPAALALAGAARADDDGPAAAAGLERAVRAAIERAEPAVACVLVSRRTTYQQFGQLLATPEHPGLLGDFNAEQAATRRRGPFDDRDRLRLARELDLADPGNVPDFYGSGLVIDPAGLVLTNYHVVRDATKVFVRLPGRRGSYADIHAADARADLAVLRLLAPPGPLPAARLGDGGAVRKGQFVVALANPHAAGYADGSPSASFGIVSNVRRRAASTAAEYEKAKPLHHYGTLLQTDARLNLGCSGGALVNLKGEVVGLTTALAAVAGSETAGGFAVPTTDGLRRVIDKLRRGEEVEYGFLGVAFDARGRAGFPPGPRDGIRLTSITANGPAARAGLQAHDVLTAVNGVPVREIDDLYLTVGTLLAGARAVLAVDSPGRGPRSVEAVLAKFHHGMPRIVGRRPDPVRGLRVDYPDIAADNAGNTELPEAVRVVEVQPGSPADRAGVKDRDLIAAVNGRAVSTPADFLQAAGAAGPLRLRLSGGDDREVTIP